MKLALLAAAFFALTGGASLSLAQEPGAQRPLTLEEVVAVAERFVRDNGYTDAPVDELKASLDFESIEFGANREELLASAQELTTAESDWRQTNLRGLGSSVRLFRAAGGYVQGGGNAARW